MFEKNDKRRLYWLMNMYLSKKIDAWTFCDEYYYSYDLEINSDTLDEKEYKAFSELSQISGRFTNIESDLKNYPGVYYNEKELKEKILQTKQQLSSFWPKFEPEGI